MVVRRRRVSLVRLPRRRRRLRHLPPSALRGRCLVFLLSICAALIGLQNPGLTLGRGSTTVAVSQLSRGRTRPVGSKKNQVVEGIAVLAWLLSRHKYLTLLLKAPYLNMFYLLTLMGRGTRRPEAAAI